MKIENIRNFVTLNRLMNEYSEKEEYFLAARVKDRISELKESGEGIDKEEEFFMTVKVDNGSPALVQESWDEWEANNTNNHDVVNKPGEREPKIGDKMRVIKWDDSVGAKLAVELSKYEYLTVSEVVGSSNDGYWDYSIWFEECPGGMFFLYEECEFVD